MMGVLRLDPKNDPVLTGFAAERIKAYATQHQTDDAQAFTNAVMASLWAGDPNTLVLLAVDGSDIIGHAVASKLGGSVTIVQVRCDRGGPEGLTPVYAAIDQWARDLQIKKVTIVTHKKPADLEKYGFTLTHSLCAKDL